MRNKKGKEEPVIEVKDFEVKGANIKDDICHYNIHVKAGMGIGTHNVKGEGIVDDDMKNAFSKLNVHLAIIDGVFKHKEIEIEKASKFNNHEITTDYAVTGFKMKGEEDNLSIVLIGSKAVSLGRMDVVTPSIILDNMGGYHFFKELKAAAETAMLEVELYIKGKFTPVSAPETSDPNQLSIDDELNSLEKARV